MSRLGFSLQSDRLAFPRESPDAMSTGLRSRACGWYVKCDRGKPPRIPHVGGSSLP